MGFWSTLAKTALPIAGSVMPGVGPLLGLGKLASGGIGAGLTVAGGLANRGGGTPKPTDTGEADLSEMAKWLEPFGEKALTGSAAGFDQTLRYLQSLLGGDEAALARATAPGVNTIVSQYDAARKAASEFGGRGGGRNEMLTELPFKQASEIAKLVQGAQTDAAGKLPQIASLLGQEGLEALGLSARDLATLIQERATKREQTLKLGTGIGQIIALLLPQFRGMLPEPKGAPQAKAKGAYKGDEGAV